MGTAPEVEEALTGGNTAASVVRRGMTVRKPAAPSSASVQSLLAHLRRSGLQSCPEPLGFDAEGRQVLEYVVGPMWTDSPTHPLADLRRVGALIRALHQASESFHPPEGSCWDPGHQQEASQLLCHNDLAPWNLVCGPERWAFIDWDAAAPATRLWDLAWACIAFPPFTPGCRVETAATAMHVLLDGYGLHASSYNELIRLMVTRANAEHDRIVEGAQREQQPWARLHAEAHHQYWGPVAAYIEQHASTLEAMLRALDQGTPAP